MSEQIRETLTVFLKDLCVRLEKKELSEEEMLKLFHLYLTYNGKGGEKDLLKYLFTGWFLHTNVNVEMQKIPNQLVRHETEDYLEDYY